jgi:hypothetical protein
MSTMPPDQTTPAGSTGTPPPPAGGYNYPPGGMPYARMPIPGNAEFAVYLLILIFLIIIWAASDAVNAGQFVTLMVALTFGYLLSRGIAKASRVLEQ